MLGCSNTRYSQLELTAFLDYGCYCGPGPYDNSKPTPKDKADKCCQKHDECFSKYQIVAKCKDNPKYKSYAWQCINGRAVCTYWKNNSYCAKKTCRCDQIFAKCMKNVIIKNKFKKVNKSKCVD